MAEESHTEIEQKNIRTQGGDVVAGNKTETHYDTKIVFPVSPVTSDKQLESLYRKLESEIATDKRSMEDHKLLQELTATDEDEVIGLQKKLENGKMSERLEYAEDAKECYVRNFTKVQFFESGQVIHAILLNRLISKYQGAVAPKLKGLDPSMKLEFAQKRVLEELRQQLGENPLLLQDMELDGMLFFLTGKCKLKWD